ncbi:hypothetical protein GCM10023165_08680 [Variovorax defluvii]|uniref:Uncharacterized protein n=1 Tax=Variovorax defluvii TaxID=913761 RepID=A0ABP8H2P1_9BURK
MLPKIGGSAVPPHFFKIDTSGAGVPAATLDKRYWTAVAQKVKAEFRQIYFLKLAQVRDLIKESIPPDLLPVKEPGLHQIDAILSAARGCDDVDMPDVARRLADFTSVIVKELNSKNRDEIISHYGGPLGNRIYQVLTQDYMIPMLSSFWAQFNSTANHCDHGERLLAMEGCLSAYFQLAGEARGQIAMLTGSDLCHDFGEFTDCHAVMMDPVPRWPKWQNHLIEKMTGVFTPRYLDFKKKNPNASPHDFISADGIVCKKVNARLALFYYYGQRVGRFYEKDDCEERVCYRFKWSMEGPPQAPLVISDLTCHHPSQYHHSPASVLPKDFSAALLLKDNHDELEDTLASIFFECSQMTLFRRGQASIDEMTVKALANCLGYAFEFSYPAHFPSPDQVALVKFDDRPGFIDEARAYFTLRPLEG